MQDVEGMTTRQMLRDAGVGVDAIDAMLHRGDLLWLHRGVYRLRGAPNDRRRALLGALLALGAPVAVTDRDALWIAGHIEEPIGDVDLLLPRARNPARPRGSRIRTSTRFEHCEQRRIGVFPVVSPAWAVTDAAKTSSRREFARLLTGGVSGRWTSLEEVRTVLAVRDTFPGCGRIRRLLEELSSDMPYSKTEQRLATACRRAGMPSVLNRCIRAANGAIVALADLCFEDRKLIVEVDGPHHWLPDVAAADRVRDRRLQALGWRVIRFSVYEIDADIEAVVQEIRLARGTLAAA